MSRHRLRSEADPRPAQATRKVSWQRAEVHESRGGSLSASSRNPGISPTMSPPSRQPFSPITSQAFPSYHPLPPPPPKKSDPSLPAQPTTPHARPHALNHSPPAPHIPPSPPSSLPLQNPRPHNLHLPPAHRRPRQLPGFHPLKQALHLSLRACS